MASSQFNDFDKKDDVIPTISLLEERLIARIDRQKIGEIVIRKEVETQIIEIPIRREKLIVEQISPVYKQIAIIDLSSDQDLLSETTTKTNYKSSKPIFKKEFESIKSAIQFLEAFMHSPDPGKGNIKIEIKMDDSLALIPLRG
jgi:hypothetical protein